MKKLVMERYRLVFVFCALMASINIYAESVTEKAALEKAQQFMKGKVFKPKHLRRAQQKEKPQQAVPYYVFNADANEGFVIVSGDDRTVPILGYSDKGAIDLDNLPENLKAWLEGYSAEISSLTGTESKLPSANPSWTAIDPLVECHWGQDEPYNLQCPVYDEAYSVTGCVATAMAQVMYYHKWPVSTTMEIPAYTSKFTVNGKTYQSALESLPITTFKWDRMKDSYNSNETGDAADAVAELMRYCGQAVEMKYSPSSSGANVYAAHMVKYFGYSAKATDIKRADYYTQEWEQIIYNELANNRPVLYSGSSSSGGHQFVCDGYDGNGMFHINWGWDGDSDGFFVLSVLNPQGRGIGGGTAKDGYTRGQWAIIGIEPATTDETAVPILYIDDISYTNSSYSRDAETEDFCEIALSSRIYTFDEGGQINHAWALGKGGECLQILGQSEVTMNSSQYTYPSGTISFGSGLADGEYELYDVYSAIGSTDWRKAIETGTYRLIATIAGNTLTLKTASAASSDLQVNSVTLQGDYKTGRPMTATMELTNLGYAHEQTLYLWENGSNIAKMSTYIDNGLTRECVIPFSPSKTGSVTYKITSNSNGNDILWSEVVSIELTGTQSLSADISIEGLKNYAIAGTTVNATITLENTGVSDFNDNVYFDVYPLDDFNDVTEQVRKVEIAQGGSTTVQVEFPNLKTGHNYSFAVRYYSGQDLILAEYIDIKVGYVFVPCKMSANIAVANGTNARKIFGTTLKSDVILTNTGAYDYNDRITTYLLKKEGNYWYYKTFKETDLQLPVGETTTIPVTFSDLEEGGEYKVYTYYYPENNQTLAGSSLSYTMVADAVIAFADAKVKALCVASWDSDGDGELSMGEAAMVTDIGTVFKDNTEITSVSELQYFTALRSIGSSAFSGCTSLNAVVIPNFITSIGTAAFSGCSSLTSVTVELLTPLSIDSECFTNRANATLYVPVSGQALYQAADYWKEFGSITAVDGNISFADASVKSICVAQWDTNSDGELSMSEAAAVTDIGTVFKSNSTISAFNELQYFTELTSINYQAFYNCKNLTSIIIPGKVTTIDSHAFQGCSGLSSIKVEAGNTVFDSRDNCNAIIRTSDNALIYGCMNTVIPGTVTTIEGVAFNGCSNLKFIIIPSSVTYISSSAFGLCNGLDYISVEEGNTAYDSRNNCNAVIRTMSNYLAVGTNNTVIPEGVTSIGESAFSYRTGLTSIVLPSSLRTIYTNAFYYCTGLTSVILPKGLTSIEGSPFFGCSNLTAITIPGSVTSMSGYNIFAYCSKLVNVRVERTEPLAIKSNAFSNRANATLYVPIGSKASYEAADYWKEFQQIIEIGNVNGDGQVDAQDASLVLQYVAKKTDTIQHADINNDGKIDAQDASLILQYVAKKITW